MIHAVATLNALGRWLVEHLWPLSVELAVLAAVVLLAIAVLRLRSPAWRHLFWWIVLAKPVATLLIASPVSLYGLLHPAVPAVAPAAAPAAAEGSWARAPAWPARYNTNRPGVEGPAPAQPSAWLAGWRAVDGYGLAAIGWLGAAFLLSVRLLAGLAYVSFLRGTARPVRDGPLAQALAAARGALRLRRNVRVALSDVTAGPVLAGIFRPVILLPSRVAEGLTPDQLEMVVSHELSHVRRWDNLALLVQRLAEIALFFHPVVWFCGWIMRREAEAACDEAVLAAHGRREQYADSLTRVAELRGGLRNRLLVNTFAADESNFARRVRRILRGRAVRRTLAVSVASAVALVLIGCLGLPGAGKQGGGGATVDANSSGARRTEEKHMATGTAKIIRDGDRVYIDGFQKEAWHEKNSVIATISGSMTALGEDASYEYLMGVSGQAFRVQFHQINGCPSSACAPCGYNTMNVALEALGYDVTWYLTEKDVASQELARRAVIRAVNIGRPAILASEECGLIVGYAKGGQELLCREYYAGGKEGYTAVKSWPWTVAVFGEKRVGKDRSALVRESLGRAVALYSAPDFPEPNKYAEGLKAYRLWIDLLEDDARVGKLDKDQLFGACHANAYCYYCLMDARAAGAKYLRSIAPQFKPDAAASLTRAAGFYEQITQAIQKGREGLPRSADLYPWKLDGGKAWTSEMRHVEADILKDCVKLEQQALAELSRAAQIENIPVSKLTTDTKPYGVEIGGEPNRQPATAPATAPAVVPSARAVVLKDVVASFERMTKDDKELNHSRTDLLMRQMFLRAPRSIGAK